MENEGGRNGDGDTMKNEGGRNGDGDTMENEGEKKNEGNDDTMENEGGRNGDTVEKEAAEGRGEWGDRRRKVVGRGGGRVVKKKGWVGAR